MVLPMEEEGRVSPTQIQGLWEKADSMGEIWIALGECGLVLAGHTKKIIGFSGTIIGKWPIFW